MAITFLEKGKKEKRLILRKKVVIFRKKHASNTCYIAVQLLPQRQEKRKGQFPAGVYFNWHCQSTDMDDQDVDNYEEELKCPDKSELLH